MTSSDDPSEVFEAVVRANQYMVLATADGSGVPWASPVWFATVDSWEFFWVSSPNARHSQNLAVRPELAITIFDSRQAPGAGQGVYISALAMRVAEDELDDGMAIFSAASQRAGMRPWGRVDVVPPARHRLYRATAVERFVLSPRDERLAVPSR